MAHIAPHQPSNDPAALSAMPDDRLMVLFRLGNSEAFSELFHRYSNSICGFFHRRIENPSRAEELAQEVFIVVLRKGERYEPRATFALIFTRSPCAWLWPSAADPTSVSRPHLPI